MILLRFIFTDIRCGNITHAIIDNLFFEGGDISLYIFIADIYRGIQKRCFY